MITWGVDCAAAHVAVAVVDDGRLLAHAHPTLRRAYSRGLFPDRLRDLEVATQTQMDLLADEHPPAYVLIEQPVGARGKPAPTLMAAWGVVTAVAVRVAARQGGVVGWATPPAWRSAADAGPDKAAALVRARSVGYDGSDLDVAEAVCMALAGAVHIRS